MSFQLSAADIEMINSLSIYENKLCEILDVDNIERYIAESRLFKLNEEVETISVDDVNTEDKGLAEYLVDLYNAITNNGSPLGILQLILDIIGVFGDLVFTVTGIPLGTIADLLNGFIYLYNKDGLNGLISIASAVLPFVGDTLKILRSPAKIFNTVFVDLMKPKSGEVISKKAAKTLAKLDPQSKTKALKFLNTLKKYASQIASKLLSLIHFVSDKIIGVLVEYIPFIGKPLKRFFKGLADKAKVIADNLSDYAKTIDNELELVLKADVDEFFKKMNSVLRYGSGKIIKEGDDIVILAGKKEMRMPISEFKKITKVSKKFKDGHLANYVKASDTNLVKFYNFLAKKGYTAKKLLRSTKFGRLRGVDIAAFIAKNYNKILGYEENNKTMASSGDLEKEAISNIVAANEINDAMLDMIDKEAKEKDAGYVAKYADMMDEDSRKFLNLLYCDMLRNIKESGAETFYDEDVNDTNDCKSNRAIKQYMYQVAKEENESAAMQTFFLNAASIHESIDYKFKYVKPLFL